MQGHCRMYSLQDLKSGNNKISILHNLFKTIGKMNSLKFCRKERVDAVVGNRRMCIWTCHALKSGRVNLLVNLYLLIHKAFTSGLESSIAVVQSSELHDQRIPQLLLLIIYPIFKRRLVACRGRGTNSHHLGHRSSSDWQTLSRSQPKYSTEEQGCLAGT